MATKINQKEYLKKYLSNDADNDATKKKKKKSKSKAAAAATARATVRIIDDDVDISRLQRIDDHDLDAYAIGEEAPQIVGVVDDRPAEMIASEDYTQSEKWKVLRTVDGALTVHQLDRDGKMRAGGGVALAADEQPEQRRFTRYESDEDDAANRDCSPVRRGHTAEKRSKGGKRGGESGADRSPARRNASRPRRSRSSSSAAAASPVRRKERRKSPRRQSRDRDTAASSRRRRSTPRRSPSPQRSRSRHQQRSNVSRTPDASPPRRVKRERSSVEPSTSARIKREPHSDADQSPARRGRSPDASPPRRNRRRKSSSSAGSDQSPARRNRRSVDASPPRRNRRISDASPPRRNRRQSPAATRRQPADDQSPPRRVTSKREASVDLKPAKMSRWSRDRSTQPTEEKMARTLDGKAAGLQSAKAVRKESDKMRSREAAIFEGMSESVSGRGAEAVVRDRRTGRVRDVEAEMAVEHEKTRKELERKAVYDRWGKGVKQLAEHQERRADEQHEASKPVARYADDSDRDALLRQRVRVDDPMLEYVRGKQSAEAAGKPARPIYAGAYPDNRFGIRPGYRWDGVDRSNGFEKRWFEVQSRSKAAEEETYKYMTEDM